MVPSGQRREPGPEISKCGLPEAAGSVLKLPLLTLSPGAGTLRASACSSSACPPGAAELAPVGVLDHCSASPSMLQRCGLSTLALFLVPSRRSAP